MLNEYISNKMAIDYYLSKKDEKEQDLELRMNLLEMALQLIEERLEKCEKKTGMNCSRRK